VPDVPSINATTTRRHELWMCQARFKLRSEKRCHRASLVASRHEGKGYCARHGGTRSQPQYAVRNHHLPAFYSRVLTDTLAEAVKAQTDAAHLEQLDLLQELAIVRYTAGDAARVYGVTEQAYLAEEDAAKKLALHRTLLQAGQVVRDVLSDVAKLVVAATNVQVLGQTKIDVVTLNAVVGQIVRIAHDTFGDDPRAVEFERACGQLRVAAQQGTESNPDEDVGAMDDSVPRAPEPGDDNGE